MLCEHGNVSPCVECDIEPLRAENEALRARVAELSEALQAIGWITEDYETDKSATTYDSEVAERWRAKGWPVEKIFKLPCPPAKVQVPEVVKVPWLSRLKKNITSS